MQDWLVCQYCWKLIVHFDETFKLSGKKKEKVSKKACKTQQSVLFYCQTRWYWCAVAFGLRGAGYDLRELVNEDIKNNPEKYNIKVRDKNIDYRRVRNLFTYLEGNSINLSTDIKNIDEWQGGDIVVFSTHIGIVSDKRNKKGIPYVIHHERPYQEEYEEDILGSRKNDIKGHFRVS